MGLSKTIPLTINRLYVLDESIKISISIKNKKYLIEHNTKTNEHYISYFKNKELHKKLIKQNFRKNLIKRIMK